MAHGLVRRESVETEMHKSEDQKKAFVYTKKRGYDVTRNPNLNKVSAETHLREFQLVSVNNKVDKLAAAFAGCGKYGNLILEHDVNTNLKRWIFSAVV